jgi:hypothetical protein
MAPNKGILDIIEQRGDFSCWFDNSEKGDVSGQIEWMGG